METGLKTIVCRPAGGPQELGGPDSFNRTNPRFLRHYPSWTAMHRLLSALNAQGLSLT